jgi:glycosyltransferase involved in cell wall biosynthesis
VVKILILNASHLANNPRVIKEADALSAAGHEVEVLGWAIDDRLSREDEVLLSGRAWKFTRLIDLRPGRGGAKAKMWRLQKRLAFELSRWTGRQTAAQLGGWRRRYLAEARRRNADLSIAHSAPMMWVASQLRREGRAVGLDLEDWFSREQNHPFPCRVISGLERDLLTRGVHATCPSRAMSEAVAAAYRCAPPAVVYNVFRWSEREHLDDLSKDRGSCDVVSIHWYSQTVGPGRGLEQLCAVLPRLARPVELHIRGAWPAGSEAWLMSLVESRFRKCVKRHRPVPNRELLSRIAEHDIGFCGETSSNVSRNLSVTNKMFQYLLAGLAVAASDTAGQKEVQAVAGEAISIFRENDTDSLASVLNSWLENPDALVRAKEAAVKAARDYFCWERCEATLVESVARACGEESGRTAVTGKKTKVAGGTPCLPSAARDT